MPSLLPEIGLESLTKIDHRDHHSTIHETLNRLLDSSTPGDVLMASGGGGVSAAQPHFAWPGSTHRHEHTTAGLLTIELTAETKGVIVTASADITGLQVLGWEYLGGEFGQFGLRIDATQSIALSWPSSPVRALGAVPTSASAGTSVAAMVVQMSV